MFNQNVFDQIEFLTVSWAWVSESVSSSSGADMLRTRASELSGVYSASISLHLTTTWHGAQIISVSKAKAKAFKSAFLSSVGLVGQSNQSDRSSTAPESRTARLRHRLAIAIRQ